MKKLSATAWLVKIKSTYHDLLWREIDLTPDICKLSQTYVNMVGQKVDESIVTGQVLQFVRK